MPYVALNNARSTLAAGLGNNVSTDLSITLQAGDGALFEIGANHTYLWLEATGKIECVKLASRAGDVLTIAPGGRAQDGTTVQTWNIGDTIECRPCAAAITDIKNEVAFATLTQAAATKATPADADLFGFLDSAAAFALKKFTWANLKTALDSVKWSRAVLADSATAAGTATTANSATTAANGHQTGEVATFLRAAAPSGWLALDGNTIGNGASGATGIASATAEPLYLLLWAEFDNTILPIQDSAGTPTTRGASAAADFAANKRLPIQDMRGYFPRGWDNGRGIDAGRALGSSQADTYLNHTHAATAAAAGGHSHTAAVPNADNASAGTGAVAAAAGSTSAVADHTHTLTVSNSTTGGTETRPKNIALLYCVKL